MARAASKSEDELRLINVGATTHDLAAIFDVSHKTVMRKVPGKVSPSTPSGHAPVRYHIREAAPFLCKLDHIDPEEYLKNLTPETLPPKLQKAYWDGLTARQEYEESRGQLWRTEKVVQVLGEVAKPVKMQLLMLKEELSQSVILPQKAIEWLEKRIDLLLKSVHDGWIEAFKNYVPAADDNGVVLTRREEDEEDDGLGRDEDFQ
jgi:hypothetical protein